MPTLAQSATLVVAATLTLVACTSAAIDDTTSNVDVLRAGPLNTQNTLTLATGSGQLEQAISSAGATLEETASFAAFAPAAEAMAAGQIDITTGSSTALVTAAQDNPELVIFAVEANDNDTQGIIAAPGTGITSINDLAGRTVAVNEGGTGDYLLRMALTQMGMSVEDVHVANLAPPEAAIAFAAGKVDAWATWDQYLASGLSVDGAELVTLAADVGATNRTVHVTTRDFLNRHPELIRAAYDALAEQAEAVIADPEVLAAAYRANGAPASVAQTIAAKTPPKIEPADDDFTQELQAVADFYAAQGLTTTATDVSKAVVDVRELP